MYESKSYAAWILLRKTRSWHPKHVVSGENGDVLETLIVDTALLAALGRSSRHGARQLGSIECNPSSKDSQSRTLRLL